MIGIELFLIAKTDWLQCQDSFAGFVHRFDVILVARGGLNRAELTAGVDVYRCAVAYGFTRDAANERLRLGSRTNPGDVGIGTITENTGADIDVVAATTQV